MGDVVAGLSPEELEEIEAVAVEFARLAGAEIIDTLQREIVVEYKQPGGPGQRPADPVSEVDHAVEQLIRARLAERFPTHGIIGEEIDLPPDPSHETVWVIDPVDGTANFINGFPLFACSIGVLHQGEPVVGAIWTSTSHALRPGVYHARRGGSLQFDEEPVPLGRPSAGVRRRLAAAPGGSPARARLWDHRTTGSAAIECAFVAAGIFTSSIFWAPSIWDVAGGAVLVEAAGLERWTRTPGGKGEWAPLVRFEAPPLAAAPPSGGDPARPPSLREWRQPLILGASEAAAELRSTALRSGWWGRSRLRRWLRRGSL